MRSTDRCALALLMLTVALPAGAGTGRDLYAQATAMVLDHAFPSPRVEYLLLDVHFRQTIAMRWPEAGQAVPVGSLLKPFVALGYARLHAGQGFPVVRCTGHADRCWRGGGHGTLTLEQALGVSCNAYFLALARSLTASPAGEEALRAVAAQYGLPAPPNEADAATLIGLTPGWRVTPLALTRAYAQLDGGETSDPTARKQLLEGMRRAALPGGTAAGIGAFSNGAMAKTGTAPCMQGQGEARCVASGDGLAVVLTEGYALLVRERGTTGAEAARVAGAMLRRIGRETSGEPSGDMSRVAGR